MDVWEAARICHQVNKAYCESLGDNSQEDWKDAPLWQKESAIEGVKFHLKHAPEMVTPSMSHESWLAQKKAEGWKYGQVKDEHKKTHPCFVPYDQLPIEQRVKDHLFKNTIDALRVLIVV